ncbi:MAG: hypothetical protein II062_04955 [Oscillospiraceae bacterium]|nr:hypothetical protein [Oscillospiraceae bacterium]
MGTTKLGVPAKLLACLAYLVAFFSGYVGFLLVAGYVLIREQNDWLRFHTLKACLLMLCFSILSTLISLIPNLFTWINDLIGIFGGYFRPDFIYDVQSWLTTTLNLLQKLLFLLLAFKAFKGGDLGLGPIDKLVNSLLGKLPTKLDPSSAPAEAPKPAEKNEQ